VFFGNVIINLKGRLHKSLMSKEDCKTTGNN